MMSMSTAASLLFAHLLRVMPSELWRIMLGFFLLQLRPVDGCLAAERDALLEFKAGVQDDTSHRLSSWRSGRDCCGWAGVVCDTTTGHVVELNLGNPHTYGGWKLRGETNSSLLLALTELEHLDLSYNYLSEISFPGVFVSFKKLRYLNLACTYILSGSSGGSLLFSLGNLSSLQHLDLHSCTSEESLESLAWLHHLPFLEYLDLSYLSLQNVNDWLLSVNKLPSLRVLRLQGCAINTIPVVSAALFNLTSLSTLDLSHNSFVDSSSLTQWVQNTVNPRYLPKLNDLILAGNLMPGNFPCGLEHMVGLKTLDLSQNLLNGSVPTWIGKLANLRDLSLAYNSFTGVILEAHFGSLAKLETLDLSDNLLNGTVPTRIGKLANLTKLSLSHNSFTGVIMEAHFENLARLEKLDLSNNLLNGSIPTRIGKLANLTELSLTHNFFTGVLLEAHFEDLARLETLDLSNNLLNGIVPTRIGKLANLTELSLSHNSFTGIPHFEYLTSLHTLDLSSNNMRGHLSPSLDHLNLVELYLDSNQFEGPLPLTLPSTLEIMKLSKNSFAGPLPRSICKCKELLFLDLSQNNLSGEVPYCLGESLQSLLELNLGNNNFTGNIPNSFGSLQYLFGLKLNNNHFTGEIHSLQNCTYLAVIDLGQNNFSGMIPSWTGEIVYLRILRLHSNTFSGEIPLNIFQLEYLRILDLANNNIFGTIPHFVSNLTSMATGSSQNPMNESHDSIDMKIDVRTKGVDLSYDVDKYQGLEMSLDLSSNCLSGEIPKEIGNLRGLRNLNLTYNQLAGKIPEQLGEMGLLESLDLSMNDFVGSIPESLSALTFLSHLNLSYNNLTGRIPSGHQLQTMENTSYLGNPGLWGLPLSSNNAAILNGDDDQHRAREDLEIIWTCTNIILGLVMGFWSFCGVLVFKRAWRYSYFRRVDDSLDRLYVQSKVILGMLGRQG